MIRTLLPAAAAASLLAVPASAETLLAIFAHPDDELTAAPLLAKYAREGHDVHLALVTKGDAGPGVSDYEPGEELAAVRAGEAQCSANALGLRSLGFAEGFGDGQLGAQMSPPAGRLDELAASLGRLLERIDPDTIVTWGPDGGYGHPDHRLTSAVVTQLVQSIDTEEAPRLLYVGVPSFEGPLPPAFADWATTDPANLNVTVPFEDADLNATRAAFLCHETQFDEVYRRGAPDFLNGLVWKGAIRLRDWNGGEASESVFRTR